MSRSSQYTKSNTFPIDMDLWIGAKCSGGGWTSWTGLWGCYFVGILCGLICKKNCVCETYFLFINFGNSKFRTSLLFHSLSYYLALSRVCIPLLPAMGQVLAPQKKELAYKVRFSFGRLSPLSLSLADAIALSPLLPHSHSFSSLWPWLPPSSAVTSMSFVQCNVSKKFPLSLSLSHFCAPHPQTACTL